MIYKSKIIVSAKQLIDDGRWEFKRIKKDSTVNVEWMGNGNVQFKTEDDKLFQLPLDEFLFAFVEMKTVDVQEEYIDGSGYLSCRIVEELREVSQ